MIEFSPEPRDADLDAPPWFGSDRPHGLLPQHAARRTGVGADPDARRGRRLRQPPGARAPGRDAAQVAGVAWASLWPQPERRKVQEAIDAARAGKGRPLPGVQPRRRRRPALVGRGRLSALHRRRPASRRPPDVRGVPQHHRPFARPRRRWPSRRAWKRWASSPAGVAHDFNNLLTVILGATETPGGRAAGRLGAPEPRRGQPAGRRARGRSRTPAAGLLPSPVAGAQSIECSGHDRLGAEPRPAPDPRGHPDDGAGPPASRSIATPTRRSWRRRCSNLCINARDAMPSGGALSLEAEGVTVAGKAARHLGLTPGAFVVFSVRDTGCRHVAGDPAPGHRTLLHHQGPGGRQRAGPQHGLRASPSSPAAA